MSCTNSDKNNISQKVLIKGLVDCVSTIIDHSDISEMVGEWYPTLSMLTRIDELLDLLYDQNVVLGEEDLHTLNQHLDNLETLRDDHETSTDAYEEVVCNLLKYLRKIVGYSIIQPPLREFCYTSE